MGRYRKYKRRYKPRSKKISKEEQFQLIIAGIIFIVLFVFYTMFGFISNCVLEWPPRWDVSTCWSEQIDPAKGKAIEKAIQFVP
jgi:hypothetical protein